MGHAILDTPREAFFDRITRLVARLLHVPIATVTLVDEHRLWFKSHHGLELTETRREGSFCNHAILDDEIMVVADAANDERFLNNAWVAGPPEVRFYAGVPLRSSDGFALGTLCAMGYSPRELDSDERETMSDLAALIVHELDVRAALWQKTQQAAGMLQVKLGVVVNNPGLLDSPIVFANPGFLAMTGYAANEVVGRNCRFLQGADTDHATVDKIREAIAERRTFQGELLNYKKDGSPFWNELTISPIFDEEGALVSFVGIQADVTDRRRTADQLKQAYDQLRAFEALRDNLTSMIIHDLRAPLTGIIAFLDLLKITTSQKLNAEEVGFIEMASKGAATLAEMITSLLDVGRLEAGEMPMDIQRVDLRNLIHAATEPFLAAIGTRSLSHDLPDCAVEVLCDAGLVVRVLANLISNAVKFTPERGEICISATPEDGRTKVSVRDTGAGIPPEHHVRIFEKFGQVDGQSSLHSTGLGLAFCRLAIEAHNGAIGVESSEGQGSTFWFVI